MENEKVKYLINMINDMDIKDKLRLSICMSNSSSTNNVDLLRRISQLEKVVFGKYE